MQAGLTEDFLTARHSRRDSKWFWHKTMAPFYGQVFGCAFPITRLSRNAIEFLHGARIALAEQIRGISSSTWPNDEAFVSTTLGNCSSFSIGDITNTPNTNFKYFSTTVPLLKENFMHMPGVFHPALTWQEFYSKFPDRLVKAVNGKREVEFLKNVLGNLDQEQLVRLFVGLANEHCISLSPKSKEELKVSRD
jgi:hypothetical protein